jgi:hypothetical protein
MIHQLREEKGEKGLQSPSSRKDIKYRQCTTISFAKKIHSQRQMTRQKKKPSLNDDDPAVL